MGLREDLGAAIRTKKVFPLSPCQWHTRGGREKRESRCLRGEPHLRSSKKSKRIEKRLRKRVDLADNDPEVPEGMVSSRRFQKAQ